MADALLLAMTKADSPFAALVSRDSATVLGCKVHEMAVELSIGSGRCHWLSAAEFTLFGVKQTSAHLAGLVRGQRGGRDAAKDAPFPLRGAANAKRLAYYEHPSVASGKGVYGLLRACLAD
jgi:hypothetical protein